MILNIKLNKFTLSIVLFVYMLLISNFHNSLLSLLGLLFCLYFLNQPQYLLPHILLTSLLGDYFIAFSGIGMGRILAIIFVAAAFVKKLRANPFMRATRFWGFGILAFYIFFSSMFSLTGSMTPAFVMILNILVVLAMDFIADDGFDDILALLRYCVLIMTVDILYLLISGRAVFYYDRLLLHASLNSNGLGMALVQMIVVLVATLVNRNIPQRKILSFAAVAFLLIVILLTGSRTSLIAILGAVCVMSIYYGATRHTGLKRTVFICLPICLTLAVALIIQHVNLDVLSRFSLHSILQTGGTGRAGIWSAALKDVFPKHPILGVGFGVENTIAALEASSLPNNVGIHNMYISLLIQVGIVGTILFLSIIIGYYVLTLKKLRFDERMLLPAMMITAALINGIGEEVYGERFLWMAIGFSLMIMHNKAVTAEKHIGS